MKNLMNGQAASTAPQTPAQAQRLADLRFMVLDTVNYSPFTTAEEKAKTAASVARCQNADTLVKWYCNVLTLLSERELAAPAPAPAPLPMPTPAPLPVPTAPVIYATTAQKEQIIRLLNHPAVSRPVKTKVLLRINRLEAAQAVALIADLTALTTPTRPTGAGLVVNRRGQLAVAALTRYADKVALAGGVSVSYVQAA